VVIPDRDNEVRYINISIYTLGIQFT